MHDRCPDCCYFCQDCADYDAHEWMAFFRLVCKVLFALTLLAAIVFCALWLLVISAKPSFTLQDMTVYNLAVINTSAISVASQLTLASRIPKQNVEIDHNKLDVFASYRGQKITEPASVQPAFHWQNRRNVWFPFVVGSSQPVASYITDDLSRDQASGMILVDIKVRGRVSWKVGSLTMIRYHLNVNCPAKLPFLNKLDDPTQGSARMYSLNHRCTTTVRL